MKGLRIKFCLIFIGISVMHALGQDTKKNTLSVPKYPETEVGNLLRSLPDFKADTGKVWQLYKIASVYWWRRSDIYRDLDSCIYFAQQANQLSNTLHFREGREESVFLMCKTYAELGKDDLAIHFISGSSPEQQARLWLVLGDHYMNLPGGKKENLDVAFRYLTRALHTGQMLKDAHWLLETRIALGKYYFLTQDQQRGKQYFLEVIRYWQSKGNLAEEAHWWSDLGRYMPTTMATRREGLSYLEHSLELYSRLKDKPNMAYAMDDLAGFYKAYYSLDTAGIYLTKAIALLKESGINKLYRYYYNLADVYQKKGDLKQALANLLTSLDNMELLGDERMKGIVYANLGEIYYALGDNRNSVKYYLLSMPLLTRTGYYLLHYNAKNVTDCYIRMGKAQAALNFILDFQKLHPAESALDKVTIFGATGNCYQALGQMQQAEGYYLKMIDEDLKSLYENLIYTKKSLAGSESYYLIGRFYINQKKYTKAIPFLKRLPGTNHTAVFLKDIELLRFKVDSALGNWGLAVGHYQKYTSYKDSLYNVESAGKLADMEVKYETKQREKDIRLLQKETQLQERRIAQSTQLRNFSLAGIAMLGLMIGIGYNRYRLKQNSFRQLEIKQDEINEKNVALQQLNHKQACLIAEKEWLVKEIHHRVKNNLQLMDSLLKTQQHYTQDEAAYLAIQTGQHRVQAMSMVHQKLYLTEHLSQVEMQSYVHDLVNSLKKSFDAPERISLKMDVAQLKLDVVQAIPVGLIINEGITNAFKYAFPHNERGEIKLVLRLIDEQILLQIKDNGIGFDSDSVTESNASFGMTLIRGLCQQLQGELDITNDHGLSLTLKFTPYFSLG